MTAYNGIMADSDHLPDNHPYLKPDAFAINPQYGEKINGIELQPSAWRYDGSESWVGAESTRIITLTPSGCDGIRPHSFGDDNVFWRVWFDPVLIAAGMITEGVDYTINIWNAFIDATVDITLVAESNPAGIDFTVPATPVTIQKFGEDSYTFTVLRLGPPAQNSTITFVVNGVTYETEITGVRVIPFVYDPDYKSRLAHTIEFETIIARAKRLKEQRRPLRENMLVHTDVEIFAQDIDAQHFENTMRYGKGFVFAVPIYFEQIYPSTTLTGQLSFSTSNDLTKFWMLNNKAQYIIIINTSTLVGETKEISSVASGSITLENTINETFDLNYVAVYPAIFSYIQTLKMAQKTDSLAVNRIGFKEFTVGR